MSFKNSNNNDSAIPQNRVRIPLDKICVLPLFYRETIPEEYLDPMGHMNVRWYMALYDEATWHFFNTIGMTADYFKTHNCGAFALKQFISYFSEIHAGQQVAIRTRVLGRNEKRFHFMHFMINETTEQLASTFESMGTHADLKKRSSALFPAHIANAIDIQLEKDQNLDWEAPVCGLLNL